MKKVLVIYNPIAGGRKTAVLDKLPEVFRENNLMAEILHTGKKGDAFEFAKKAVEDGTELVVVIGGDGTINEVAGAITGSETVLGILPSGSGNGLARHLKIPLSQTKFFNHLKAFQTQRIDTVYLNELPFFNVSGIGFDAVVGNTFSQSTARGFNTYAYSTLATYTRFRPLDLSIEADDFSYSGPAFLLSFANSSQYGNNVFINPGAVMDDGKFELCLVRPFPQYLAPQIMWQLFNREIASSPYVKIFSTTRANIKTRKNTIFHLDGDPMPATTEFRLRIAPRSLRVLV